MVWGHPLLDLGPKSGRSTPLKVRVPLWNWWGQVPRFWRLIFGFNESWCLRRFGDLAWILPLQDQHQYGIVGRLYVRVCVELVACGVGKMKMRMGKELVLEMNMRFHVEIGLEMRIGPGLESEC